MNQGQASPSTGNRPEAAALVALDTPVCTPVWASPAAQVKEMQMDFWSMVDGWNFRLLV